MVSQDLLILLDQKLDSLVEEALSVIPDELVGDVLLHRGLLLKGYRYEQSCDGRFITGDSDSCPTLVKSPTARSTSG